MKLFKTKEGEEFFLTNNADDVLVDDYIDGAVLYAQEKLFGENYFAVDVHGKPIASDRLLKKIYDLDLAI